MSCATGDDGHNNVYSHPQLDQVAHHDPDHGHLRHHHQHRHPPSHHPRTINAPSDKQILRSQSKVTGIKKCPKQSRSINSELSGCGPKDLMGSSRMLTRCG